MTLMVFSNTGGAFSRRSLHLSDVFNVIRLFVIGFWKEEPQRYICHFYHIASKVPTVHRPLKIWTCPQRQVRMPGGHSKKWPHVAETGWGRSSGLDVSSGRLSPHPLKVWASFQDMAFLYKWDGSQLFCLLRLQRNHKGSDTGGEGGRAGLRVGCRFPAQSRNPSGFSGVFLTQVVLLDSLTWDMTPVSPHGSSNSEKACTTNPYKEMYFAYFKFHIACPFFCADRRQHLRGSVTSPAPPGFLGAIWGWWPASIYTRTWTKIWNYTLSLPHILWWPHPLNSSMRVEILGWSG